MEFRNHLLSAMARDDLHDLLPSLSEVSLERGQVLFAPDIPITSVVFPSSAVLSVVTLMRDGSAVESSTVGHESAAPLIAALVDRPVRSRIFAQIGGAAIRLSTEALRARAANSPRLMRLLLEHSAAQSFQAEQGVACNVLHNAPSRLARWLLMTQDRVGAQSVPLTQDYMAIMTGVQRTTISLVASQLRADGLIRYARGHLEILDRAGLERRACECYAVIRDGFEALRAQPTNAP